jgi:hypothetical protein
MTYASDLGLKVGSKIKVLDYASETGCCFNKGEVLQLVEDDGAMNPYFKSDSSPNRKAFSLDLHKWEHYKEELSVGIDLADEGSEKTVEALVSITQEVKYTVVIKGTTFTFTQDELDALTEELLGFTTL